MKFELDIPNCTDGVDVFWNSNAAVELLSDETEVVLKCNKDALYVLGKQLLYLYLNFENLGFGTHIHFDDFFCGEGWKGPDFVLSIIQKD